MCFLGYFRKVYVLLKFRAKKYTIIEKGRKLFGHKSTSNEKVNHPNNSKPISNKSIKVHCHFFHLTLLHISYHQSNILYLHDYWFILISLFLLCNQLPDATPEQIKKAYYNCMKSCHPDLSGNNPDTTNFCIFINEIYEVGSFIPGKLFSFICLSYHPTFMFSYYMSSKYKAIFKISLL